MQKTTQKHIDDAKKKLDSSADQAWKNTSDLSKQTIKDAKKSAINSINNNADKEYKKELNKTKEKIADIRKDAKKNTSEELDKIQNKLAHNKDKTAQSIEELEDTTDTLVSEVDFSQNEAL